MTPSMLDLTEIIIAFVATVQVLVASTVAVVLIINDDPLEIAPDVIEEIVRDNIN